MRVVLGAEDETNPVTSSESSPLAEGETYPRLQVSLHSPWGCR